MIFPRATVSLPGWVEEFFPDPGREYPTEEDRMRLVIELSRSNVDHGTGGPFGAGIFDLSTNRLVAPGVNLVATANLSAALTEMVAIMIYSKSSGISTWAGRACPRTSWSPARSHARCASARSRGRASGDSCAGRARRTHAPSGSTRDRSVRLGSIPGAARHLRGAGRVPRRGGSAPVLRRERWHDLQRPAGCLN